VTLGDMHVYWAMFAVGGDGIGRADLDGPVARRLRGGAGLLDLLYGPAVAVS
jgi:hypothetical protein